MEQELNEEHNHVGQLLPINDPTWSAGQLRSTYPATRRQLLPTDDPTWSEVSVATSADAALFYELFMSVPPILRANSSPGRNLFHELFMSVTLPGAPGQL